jgi:hypothetical protein
MSQTLDLRRDVRQRRGTRKIMSHGMQNDRHIRWRNIAAIGVCAFGLSAMLGDTLQVPALKGIGLASAMAPCPKVFCDTRGLEGFASKFALRFETSGQMTELELTPELYAKLEGPYNRRNVYGAALSFAPRLPESLWRAAFDYSLAEEGPLRRELGIPREATNITVLIRTKTRGRSDQWELTQR